MNLANSAGWIWIGPSENASTVSPDDCETTITAPRAAIVST